MKSGRKPLHNFNTMRVGQKSLLDGNAAKFPHQNIYQYNKRQDKIILVVIKEEGVFYAKRIK